VGEQKAAPCSLMGDKNTIHNLQLSKAGTTFVQKDQQGLREDGTTKTVVGFDNRTDKVIICSDISDALSAYSAGYGVVFANSETANFLCAHLFQFKTIS
jgi:hypothetical protein